MAQSSVTVAGRPGCTAQTRQGAPCRAFALPGRPQCKTHDPEQREAFQAASAKGGKVRALQGQRRKLDNTAALIGFTSGLIQDVLDGSQPADVARVALYGLSIQRQLVEAGDLEKRLAALEERLSQQPKGAQRWAS